MATAENLKSIPDPKSTMVVAREDGRLYVVDFTEYPHLEDPGVIDWEVSVSKLILGKVQERRTRLLTLEEVELENVTHTGQYPDGATSDLELTIYGTFDGKNVEQTFNPFKSIDSPGYCKWTCRATATNFSLQLRGTYNLNTILLTYHNNGRR